MEESFFGFDTSVPLYDDGGGGRLEEPSEEEYDALNDETFGCATNGDWEEVHENLVRLTDNFDDCNEEPDYKKRLNQTGLPTGKSKILGTDQLSDSDLEINLSEMKLDDLKVDDSYNLMNSDDILLDPSVWSPGPTKSRSPVNNGLYMNGTDGKALLYLHHFQNIYPHSNLKKSVHIVANTNVSPQKQTSLMSPVPKICTLEDIEKKIMKQNIQKQIETTHQLNSRSATPNPHNTINATKKPSLLQNSTISQNQQQSISGPPGFFLNSQQISATNSTLSNGSSIKMGYINQQQQHRHRNENLPPQINTSNSQQLHINNAVNVSQGSQQQVSVAQNRNLPFMPPILQHGVANQVPPHPLLNHSYSKNFNFPPPQNPLPSPHIPIALNNFTLHPNFAAIRAATISAGIHHAFSITHASTGPRFPNQQNPQLVPNQQQPNAMFNMFNSRLVQEIQQNHPLLQASMRNVQHNVGVVQNSQQKTGIHKGTNSRRETSNANGNLPLEDFDEYANLMSTRDKHWLIGIQLSQLNSDTPYIDDYYYTVFRERKASINGILSHSKAHKDNQLNHPLTQPKGHAQLVMVQLGNKNGTRNVQQRERRSSENNEQRSQYAFTNYKFENSLGKLQFGSVNAPRKLIDADVMNSESSNQNAYTGCKSTQCKQVSDPLSNIFNLNKVTITTQRKTRDTLLHIETLFRIVLKLEDLDNPTIMATILTKKNKEIERLAVLEQIESASKVEEGLADNSGVSALNPALRNRFNYEIESKETLLEKLVAGLSQDKVISIMNVRKGKVLLTRIMPHIGGTDICWSVWISIFTAMRHIIKKDAEDPDGILYSFYPIFKKHLHSANFDIIVKIVGAISFDEKKPSAILCNKFVMSALVALILRVEKIYDNENHNTFDKGHEEIWKLFLKKAATSLENTIQNQTISAAIESEAIHPIMNHFARFKNLNLNALSNFIKEAKEQIK